MKIRLLAAALLLGAGAFAHAADAVVEDIPAGFNWTGGYVGVQVGYAWGDSYLDLTEGWGPNSGSTFDPDGFFGGAYGGYNYQFSNALVLGVDGDINLSSMDSQSDVYEDGDFLSDHVGTADLKYSGAVRARMGYAFDRWLPYLAGGLSVAKYDFTVSASGGHLDVDNSDTFVGWNIGGGVEFAATDNILVRAEYRFSDFGSYDFDDEYPGTVDLKTHDIRLGVAYKF